MNASSRADELFRKGNQLYNNQRWQDAEVAFEAAWALRQTFDIASNLGHTEIRLKKPLEAVEHLTFALQNWPLVSKASQRELAEQRMKEARAKVGALSIRVNVPGAVISIDGQKAGESPLPSEIFVTPGEHRVRVTLAGYEPASMSLAVAEGASSEASIKLRPEEKAEARVNAGVVIAGVAVSMVAGGVGLGFTLTAKGKFAEGDEVRKPLHGGDCNNTSGVYARTTNAHTCDELISAVDDAIMSQNIAVGAFVVGGVAAVGTAAYALWPKSRTERRSGIQVRPTVSFSNVGLSARGDF